MYLIPHIELRCNKMICGYYKEEFSYATSHRKELKDALVIG